MSQAARAATPTVCIVVADPDRLTGRHHPGIEDALARGWNVHCLLGRTPTPASTATPAWQRQGVHVHTLDPAHLPDAFRVRNLYEPSPADHIDRVRLALERLHRDHRFDLIEFGVAGGLGFRAAQAKRAGLAFDDVILAVRLDAPSRHDREQANRWPGSLDELEVDFAERESFERADLVIAPDSALHEYTRQIGWAATAPTDAELPRFTRTTQPADAAVPNEDAGPLVTIGIAHYNLGAYLPDTLASLAAQTYPNLEVLVIDDGSTDPSSVAVVEEMEHRYPHWRFLRQPNAGIGATRNRCLAEARGEFFSPVDADNLARPEMVERFVRALRRNPDLSAMTCYFLAFRDGGGPTPDRFLYANRPVGGPHTMACIRNVYGDANAIFRTADFKAVGGYNTERGTSCEDWEAFVKLVQAGKRIGVIPDHLFYYRHREAGFSRTTNWFANHQRVLRQFARADHLPPGEAAVLWAALLGFQQRAEQLADRQRGLRYRAADALHGGYSRFAAALRRLTRRS